VLRSERGTGPRVVLRRRSDAQPGIHAQPEGIGQRFVSPHPPTRGYVERRTAEGLSKKEIIRCLKRYAARETYPHLRQGPG
jgi:hypothetical protein